ncbi:PTS transporter subunit EIIC [Lachnospiraceae bacterium MD1]|uniref:PTS transporter subunit EIIC n=1 Tax=Variimorphobacter saccharofermentans TaxID=2755051 RepID=A0A839K3Z2_9FIRM|nr:PTS transporter subunit EIIC [Variimorphobacter saccharofermentans]MBB2183902.1 PTS transporter subunit EIIC [Variimorphobacter saccharofermentans]
MTYMSTTEKRSGGQNLFDRVMDIISGIFIPIVNVIMAAGLLKGILMLLVNANLLQQTDGAYQMLYAISDGFFHFLPVFLAFTASKKLKADTFTSVMLAAALVYPDITALFKNGTQMDLFGIPIREVTYPSSVIPIIMAVGLQHYVERPLEKYLPNAIKGFLKPMITLTVVTPITFLVFGPLGSMIGEALAGVYALLYNLSPVAAGVIFGLIWQPMVVFGLQWGLVPVIIDNISTLGMDSILPLLGPAVMGQAGAALAVSILTKDKELKSISMSGSITAILGITEPVLYGVTVPLKRPMIAACIAGAIGGGIVGTSSASAVSFAFPSMVTLVVYFGEGFWTFLIAMVIGFILGFVLTLIIRFEEPVKSQAGDISQDNASNTVSYDCL